MGFITYAKCKVCGVQEECEFPDLPDVLIRKRSGWYDLGRPGRRLGLVCSHECLLKLAKDEFKEQVARIKRCALLDGVETHGPATDARCEKEAEQELAKVMLND